MRVVHLADLHLGFRQYQRLAPGGQNQREADVAATFSRAVDAIIGVAPELIVVAGDVFHLPRPTNSAILFAFREFSRLRAALPTTPIVVVAGNHDTPRTIESGGILQLLSPLGIHVVDREARRIAIPQLELSVLAVPDAGAPRPPLEPDPDARFNVMVLHGEVQGMLRGASHGDRPGVEIPTADLHARAWDYVALGHYHVYREIAPNAWYSGSIDYTSANPWGELQDERAAGISGKGFVERDLLTGEQRFHPVSPSRLLVDLEPIDARDLSADELSAAIQTAADGAPDGIEGRIVRLVVRDVTRETQRSLDHRMRRDLQRRATHFRLDLRAPVRPRSARSIVPLRTPTITERIAQRLADRPDLAALARLYLDEAGERPAAAESDHAAA